MHTSALATPGATSSAPARTAQPRRRGATQLAERLHLEACRLVGVAGVLQLHAETDARNSDALYLLSDVAQEIVAKMRDVARTLEGAK